MLPYVVAPVHYVNYGAPVDDPDQCRAALITALPEGAHPDGEGVASLSVFNPDGNILTIRRVVQDEEVHQGGTWHWPEAAPEPAPGA